MPTYRKGEVTITKARQDFIDKVAREQVEAIAAAKVANMKLNLSSSQYRELFSQYKRQQEEHKQRLQRIEQQSSSFNQNQKQKQKNKETVNNNNTSSSSKEVVIRNLQFMQRVAGPNP